MVPPLESMEGGGRNAGAASRKEGLVPMSKKKKILLMLTKEGVPQLEVAAVLHSSKRDVSACARVLRERGLAFDDVVAMGAAEGDGLLAPPGVGAPESACLRPEMGPRPSARGATASSRSRCSGWGTARPLQRPGPPPTTATPSRSRWKC